MKSRYSNVLILFIAVLSFLPVLAVDYLLDGYVRGKEAAARQSTLDTLTRDSERTVNRGLAALQGIMDESPSLCTETFYQNVFNALENNVYLKQVLVENAQGVQYCTAYNGELVYRTLSDPVTVPASTATVTTVTRAGSETPLFKLTQRFGENRTVSVFVVAAPLLSDRALPGFEKLSFLQFALTNGTVILERGISAQAAHERAPDLLVAKSFAGEVPLKAEAGIRFSVVRGDYANLDIAFTLLASLVSALALIGALQYVRRAQLPAFDIERAIASGEMKPYYQPVFNLRTGKMTGCEVLIRWIKKNGKVVSPGAFIDYAEMTGLAIPMTLNLMEQVRDDLDELARKAPDFKIGINLFEGHFRDGAVVEDIQSIFADSAINYRQLVFEITERQPLDDKAAVNRVVSAMHALGVRVAMDDAGTGHSNLAYLHTLGFDIVKIDKIFVEMIQDANVPMPVVDGLISMAKEMDIGIIAEGVETTEQALYLRAHGVESAQGYLFSKPLNLQGFLKMAYPLLPEREERADTALAA